MTPDLQMIRGTVEGGYNLAVGEPVVLQRLMGYPKVELQAPWEYPTMEPVQAFLDELRVMHPSGHIVVTNGAKQALAATFYAYWKCGKKSVQHAAPYWPSYPTIARLVLLGFSSSHLVASSDITCVTSPNNPDGTQGSARAVNVWDAVYAHWVYGWNGVPVPADVEVRSAAKLLGLSGARVGWLVTKDERLAEHARQYVEFTTSGVSTPAQLYVAAALKQVREDPLTGWRFRTARRDLLHNGERFNTLLGEFCAEVRGVPKDGTGMFAYFCVRPECHEAFERAQREAKVALVNGAACGQPHTTPPQYRKCYYRMNMAQDCDYTAAALRAIRERL